MPDVATQAHRGPRSQGSDHGSKSQRAGTEKRAGERLLPSRSNSTRKGTHHVVKRPDQAGRRGPARGPTHLHPTRDTTVNPTTTRSYVEVVRGVAQRSGRPATVRGPPHVTRYILLPRAPTHPPQPPSAQQRHEGEGRGFVLRSPKDGPRELGGERLLCAPVGETTPQVAIPGPTSRRSFFLLCPYTRPHRRLGRVRPLEPPSPPPLSQETAGGSSCFSFSTREPTAPPPPPRQKCC